VGNTSLFDFYFTLTDRKNKIHPRKYSTPYSLYRLCGFFNKNNSLNFLYFQFFSFVNQPFLKQMSKSSFFGKILLFQEWRFFQKPVRDLA
jgi:hypothetical protein